METTATTDQAPRPRELTASERLIVETVLAALPDAVAVYLFGSRARPEDLREGSDWDVAVLAAGGGMDAMTWFDLRYDLATALEVEKVDLVDLKNADFIIRETVLDEGVLLYSGDEFQRIRWEIASEKLIEEWRPFYEESRDAFLKRFHTEHE